MKYDVSTISKSLGGTFMSQMWVWGKRKTQNPRIKSDLYPTQNFQTLSIHENLFKNNKASTPQALHHHHPPHHGNNDHH
jgi:hypothetical protein